jgi:hypothetical protein
MAALERMVKASFPSSIVGSYFGSSGSIFQARGELAARQGTRHRPHRLA